MTTASRRKGSSWELDALKYIRTAGRLIERLRLAGKNDEGDLVITFPDLRWMDQTGARHVVLEAKNEAKMNLAGYVREAQVEAENYAKARDLDMSDVHPAALVKRRNAGVGQAYVVMTLDNFLGLL